MLESGQTAKIKSKPSIARYLEEFRYVREGCPMSMASFGETFIASRAGWKAARTEMKIVMPKEIRSSHLLRLRLSTETRTNKVEIVSLTPFSKYFARTELTGIASNQPTRPKKPPSEINIKKISFADAPVERSIDSSFLREAALSATRL